MNRDRFSISSFVADECWACGRKDSPGTSHPWLIAFHKLHILHDVSDPWYLWILKPEQIFLDALIEVALKSKMNSLVFAF